MVNDSQNVPECNASTVGQRSVVASQKGRTAVERRGVRLGDGLIEIHAQTGAIRRDVGIAVLPLDLNRKQVCREGAGRAGHLLDSDVGGGHAQVHARRRAHRPQRIVRHDVVAAGLRPVSNSQGLGQAFGGPQGVEGVAGKSPLDDL